MTGPFRATLAMLMAAWTVFVCCCPAQMARSAATTDTGMAVVTAPADAQADPHACCTTDPIPDQQRPADEDHPVPPPSAPDHACGCDHAAKAAATEKAPTALSTSPAQSFNPVPDFVHLPASITAALLDELLLNASRAPIADQSAIPCAPTLLSLGCKLTT